MLNKQKLTVVPVRRLRRNRSRENIGHAHVPLPGNLWDKWLARASFAAQVITPILAVAGFVYTVIPLYSKAVLEEEIAHKQLEMESQSRRLANLNQEVEHKAQDAAKLSTLIESERLRSAKLVQETAQLNRQRTVAETEARTASEQSEKSYQSMRESVITLALQHAESCMAETLPWAAFYSPMRKWTRGETQAIAGERYAHLTPLKECILRRFKSSIGFEHLRSGDQSILLAQLRMLQQSVATELDKYDSEFAQNRDEFVAADKVTDTDLSSHSESDPSQADLQKKLKMQFASGPQVADTALQRNTEIEKRAMRSMEGALRQVERVAREQGMLHGIEEPVIAPVKSVE
jgi:hypothetical protein